MNRYLTFSRLERVGRLGNQLWQIASTAGIAHARGQEVRLPSWSYRPFFSCPESWWDDDRPVDTFYDLDSPETAQAQRAIRSAWWRPYLQAEVLFADIADDVRRWFKPSIEALRVFNNDDQAASLAAEIPWTARGQADAIAVHVRRGDTVVNGPGIQPCAPISYYMDALLQLDPNLPVVVFSDDAGWCREVLVPALAAGNPPGRYHVVDHGPGRSHVPAAYDAEAPMDWIDLQLMAQFRHHVISNSSYAWWGAFLSGDPSPLYPSRWFGPDLIQRGCDRDLVIPRGWQQVEVTEEAVTC